jgi:replicative DNA helicase
MSDVDKLPPANVDAEQSVLGSMLLDAEAVVRVAGIVAAGDFSRAAHAKIFQAMLALYDRNEAVDTVTVAAELERMEALEDVGGAAYLYDLVVQTPVAAHVEHYARVVVRASVQRQLIEAAGKIARLAYSGDADTIEQTIGQAQSVLFQVAEGRQSRELVPVSSLLDSYLDHVEEIQANRDLGYGVRTGFLDLDRLLGGLHGSDVCIVAGRPGMGKTSWLTTVAAHLAVERAATVALFSLEMSGEQVVQRLLAAETGIPASALRMGDIRPDQLELVTRAIGKLDTAPIYVDDTPGITPFDLRTKVRRLASERRVDLVMVDYLQLMDGGRRMENRVQEISYISRSLKSLAREVDVPVIAASQLSRAVEHRGNQRRPVLADLRDSGSIEQDADMVVFLYRDVVYNEDTPRPHIAEAIVAKNRHGPTGMVELHFVEHEMKFRDPVTPAPQRRGVPS